MYVYFYFEIEIIDAQNNENRVQGKFFPLDEFRSKLQIFYAYF